MAKAITMNDLIGAANEMPPDIGAIMVFAPNTYPFTLGLHGAINGIGELFRVQRESGINFAQVSEDIFGFVPVALYHKNQDPIRRLMSAMRDAASKSGVNVTSFGTGAELYTVWRMVGGICDSPVTEKPMQMCRNYIDIAESYPTSLICGHRVPTVWPELKESEHGDSFYEGCTLGHFAEVYELDIGDLDPSAELTDAEVKNLRIGLELQLYGKDRGVSSTMELMYQPGMEPITIEQMKRVAVILGNVDLPLFSHVDTGHAVVGGTGKEAKDFNLIRYAEELGHLPFHTVHYCALNRNKHEMPTEHNIAEDLRIRDDKPADVPHPESYCDVREYLDELNSRGAKLVEISPEPKEAMNLTSLGISTRNVYEDLVKRYVGTHAEHPNFRGLLVPKTYLESFQHNYG